MKTFFCSVLVMPLVGITCIGCSGTSIADLDRELRTVKNELSEVRSIQAEQTSSIGEMKSEIRLITGKIEELNFQVSGKTTELKRTLEQVSARVPPPAIVPEELLNSDEERIARIASSAANLYRQGLRELRTGDFEAAQRTFETFASQNPGTAFTDNAIFWMGVSFMGLSRNDRAILAFSEVYQKYPAEDFVPVSIYYLGNAFENMGSKREATLSYQKLIDEHPRSEWAKKARSKVPFSGSKR